MDETLQQLAQRRQRELGQITNREVWRRGGGDATWSHETVRRIVERGHHKISDRVANALARALEVPVDDVFQAAGLSPPLGRFALPGRADRLTDAERRVVISVVDAILGARVMGVSDGR